MHQGLLAVGGDLLGKRLQLFHGLRHFVAGVLEVLRRIPDQRLHVDLVGEGIEGGVTVLALVGREIDPGLAGRIIVEQPLLSIIAERRQVALGRQVANQARLRQDGNIGRAAGLGVDDDLLFVVFRGRIFELDAGRLDEIGIDALEERFVLAAPGSEDRQRLPLEVVTLLEFLEARPVEFGIFARLELQIRSAGSARKQRQRSHAQQK